MQRTETILERLWNRHVALLRALCPSKAHHLEGDTILVVLTKLAVLHAGTQIKRNVSQLLGFQGMRVVRPISENFGSSNTSRLIRAFPAMFQKFVAEL